MKITEQDIFNYVYYPEKLDSKVIEYIGLNKKLFEKQIEFCKNTLSELNNIKNKNSKLITLKKLQSLKIEQKPSYYLAADSVSLDKSIKTETFINADNNLIVKVISYNDKTKIFILNEKNDIIKNFKLIVKPSNISYNIKSSSEPIELPAGLDIEGIDVEI